MTCPRDLSQYNTTQHNTIYSIKPGLKYISLLVHFTVEFCNVQCKLTNFIVFVLSFDVHFTLNFCEVRMSFLAPELIT